MAVSEFYGRDVEKDVEATWELISDKNVTPLGERFKTVDDLPGATLKLTFYKSYGKSQDTSTGEIVDCVHILCHEFPFFVKSFPQIYESSIITHWKKFRTLVLIDVLKYLQKFAPKGFKQMLQPMDSEWIDDYSTYVLLR